MVGGLGALLVVGLTGCGDSSNNNQSQTQNQTDSTFTERIERHPSGAVASAEGHEAAGSGTKSYDGEIHVHPNWMTICVTVVLVATVIIV